MDPVHILMDLVHGPGVHVLYFPPNNGTNIWCFKLLAFKNSIEHLWGSLMMFRSCFLGNVHSKIKHISQEKLAGISYVAHTNMQIIQPFSKEMIAVDPEQ